MSVEQLSTENGDILLMIVIGNGILKLLITYFFCLLTFLSIYMKWQGWRGIWLFNAERENRKKKRINEWIIESCWFSCSHIQTNRHQVLNLFGWSLEIKCFKLISLGVMSMMAWWDEENARKRKQTISPPHAYTEKLERNAGKYRMKWKSWLVCLLVCVYVADAVENLLQFWFLRHSVNITECTLIIQNVRMRITSE